MRLWDVAGGGPKRTASEGHTGEVRACGFSPGRSLAGDGRGRRDGAAVGRGGAERGAPLEGHTGGALACGFSPDGRWLATGGADRTVRLWDVGGADRGAPLQEATREGFGLRVLAGRSLAGDGGHRTARLWDVAGRTEAHRFEGHAGGVLAWVLAGRSLAGDGGRPDGAAVGRGGKDRSAPLRRPHGGGFGLRFSPDGRWLATEADRTVRLWDVAGRSRAHRFKATWERRGLQGSRRTALAGDGGLTGRCGCGTWRGGAGRTASKATWER